VLHLGFKGLAQTRHPSGGLLDGVHVVLEDDLLDRVGQLQPCNPAPVTRRPGALGSVANPVSKQQRLELVTGFTAAFSTEALEALEAFTEFFRGRLTLFPARFESLMIDVHWLSLVEYANVVLERLARDDALVAKDG